MRINDAFRGVTRLFLDSAPVIYLVEQNPQRLGLLTSLFGRITSGSATGVTSPVTLAECLVAPYRRGFTKLQQDFFDLIVYGRNTIFLPIDDQSGRQAADLRARYNLTLPNALQVAIALLAGCEALLTNDLDMQRVTELRILLVDALEL